MQLIENHFYLPSVYNTCALITEKRKGEKLIAGQKGINFKEEMIHK